MSMTGARASACAIRMNVPEVMALPASAEPTVGAVIPAWRASSAALHPRRAISNRNRPECTTIPITLSPMREKPRSGSPQLLHQRPLPTKPPSRMAEVHPGRPLPVGASHCDVPPR